MPKSQVFLLERHDFSMRTDLLSSRRVYRLKWCLGAWGEHIQHPSSAEISREKQLAREQKIYCLFSLVTHYSKVLFTAMSIGEKLQRNL